MNINIEIHENEWPSIVAGAKKARTTPERYAQRLFNAGFDARHPETWGNKPHSDAQTLIALACAGLPDIVRVSKAVGCSPQRLERILGAWDHVVGIMPGVRLEENLQATPENPHEEPSADETCHVGKTVCESVGEEDNGGSGSIDFERDETSLSASVWPINSGDVVETVITTATIPATGSRHDAVVSAALADTNRQKSAIIKNIAQHEIPESASSSAAGDMPDLDVTTISVEPAKSSAPEPAVGAQNPGAEDIDEDMVFSGDTFAALREIAAEEMPEGLLTDDEMQTFIAFARAIAKSWPERFPVSGVANRKAIEKEAGDKFEYLTPAFRAIQKAGFLSLQPQAFSPASYFGFRVTPEGAAVILDALGNGD